MSLTCCRNGSKQWVGRASTVRLAFRLGYAAGAWTGSGGITSGDARDDASRITGVGAAVNDSGAGAPLVPALSLVTTDVLVRRTYYGDANLDGRVNAADYFRIDSAFLSQSARPTSDRGDFNYVGTVNADDYFLIDSAFLGQGAPIRAAAAVVGVPEPGVIIAALGWASALGLRRRSGSRHRRRQCDGRPVHPSSVILPSPRARPPAS